MFHVFFLVHLQCFRISASNFQVLTRKRGGGRAFGNHVRILAGPARTTIPKATLTGTSLEALNSRIPASEEDTTRVFHGS